MQIKRVLHPERLRKIEGSFSWIDHRFLTGGFLRDLCTLSELQAMAHRWHAARLLDEGRAYHEVATRTGASTTTVTRVAHWLRHGEDGYRLALDRRKRRVARIA